MKNYVFQFFFFIFFYHALALADAVVKKKVFEEYPFQKEHLRLDAKVLGKVVTFLKMNTREELLKSKGDLELAFDGKKWDAKNQTDFFKVIVRAKDKDIPINKSGSYILWDLPSSKHQKGRDRLVGIYWENGKPPRLFFAQLSILSAER